MWPYKPQRARLSPELAVVGCYTFSGDLVRDQRKSPEPQTPQKTPRTATMGVDPEKASPTTDDDSSSGADTIRIEQIGDEPSLKEKAQEFNSTAVNEDATPTAPEETRTNLETTLVIAALSSALFLAALDVTIVAVAIPTISQEFQSTAGYTWIGSAYMLASAAAAPLWGKISDIWGRKPVMLVAVAIFWIGSLLSALSKNMGMLIVARAIQGVGGGGIIILVNICISDLFSMRRRGMFSGSGKME